MTIDEAITAIKYQDAVVDITETHRREQDLRNVLDDVEPCP